MAMNTMNREIQYMNQAYLGYLAIPRGTILTIGDGHWGTDQKCLPWQQALAVLLYKARGNIDINGSYLPSGNLT